MISLYLDVVAPRAVLATPALVSFRKSRREAFAEDIQPPLKAMEWSKPERQQMWLKTGFVYPDIRSLESLKHANSKPRWGFRMLRVIKGIVYQT